MRYYKGTRDWEKDFIFRIRDGEHHAWKYIDAPIHEWVVDWSSNQLIDNVYHPHQTWVPIIKEQVFLELI